LRELAASTHPFRGNTVPAAKTAVTALRGLLSDLLKQERERALATLGDHETKLRAIDDFNLLDEVAQQSVFAQSITARHEIQSARFVTSIRDRIRRYISQEYPSQLALTAQLAHPPSTEDTDDTSRETIPTNYITASSLSPKCSLAYIATKEDLDIWLDALRMAAEAELEKGNRISL
jgi:hypothetical protein